MKSTKLLSLFACLLISVPVFAGTKKNTQVKYGAELDKLRFFAGNIQTGYYDGVGIHVSGTFANFAEGFPFAIRFGVGHAWIPSGDAILARRIFIDQATGGNNNAMSTAKDWDTFLIRVQAGQWKEHRGA